ncbi:MAG: hypothetical protein OXN83_01960, partial [Oligoflexia bacterium]|nr:hypothetical protein [Oligoflexia bacterium]
PISSLDQTFEEAVATRLVKLSNQRQVIIFTHRLSMLGLIEELSKKQNIDINKLAVTKEYWGTGEPGDTPLFAKNPKEALNNLIDKLSEAKKTLEEEGTEKYKIKADSIITNFRIIIERVIESILLGGIVQRYRKNVHTQKVKDLNKIKVEDCQLIDGLMTRYSSPLHSQSSETPTQLLEPNELEADFKKLKKWIDEFNKRN